MTRQRKLISALLAVAAVALIVAGSRRPDNLLAWGTFHPVTAEGRGLVEIRQPRERHTQVRILLLKLNEPGPVEVKLIACSDARDSLVIETVAQIHLGVLPAGVTATEFDLASNVDLNRFRAVCLWSPGRRMNLLTAPLMRS